MSFCKHIVGLIGTVMLSLALAGTAYAQDAENITRQVTLHSDTLNTDKIADGSLSTHSQATDATLQLESDIPMGFLYIKYRNIPKEAGSLNGTTAIANKGFLHEYIPLDGLQSATLTYPDIDIAEISIYSEGDVPKDVQIWQIGPESTDIMLFSTHSDDDQLFFAGLVPTYVARGACVRVAYFVNHFDTYNRMHELLDGLWHCGLTNYPLISPLPDGYSESIEGAEAYFEKQGFSHENILNLQRLYLNRCKPKVVVLHDIEGEYGHGAHMLNTASFLEVVEKADAEQFVPEKIYIHLYEEYPLTLDIDTPLDFFEGKTAFQVSQEAFDFHKSQHWTWFKDWLYGKNNNITSSTQIKTYNPAQYGLFFSNVGADSGIGDMLENIVTVAAQKEEQERKARAAEQKRLEELEKLEKQLEEERHANEQSALLEAEARERERLASEELHRRQQTGILIIGAVCLAMGLILIFYIIKKRSQN